MGCAVMGAAQRYDEFVARLAAERPRLHVAKMMRVRWLAAANEAWLLGHVAQMVTVTVATRRGNCEDTLIDTFGLGASRRRGFRLLLRYGLWRCGTVFR